MVVVARVLQQATMFTTRAPATRTHLVLCPVYEAVTQCCHAVGAAVEEAVPLAG